MMTRYLYPVLVLCLLCSSCSFATAQDFPFLAFEGDVNVGPNMYLSNTGNITQAYRTETLTDPSGTYTINNVVAAAYHPTEDAVYVLASTNPSGQRNQRLIFRLDTLNAELTFVTDPEDDYWQTLAISDDGRFFATPGNASSFTANVIHEIDTATGDATPMQFGHPGDSPVNGLTFNPFDNLLYYCSGTDSLTEDSAVVSYDPTNWAGNAVPVNQGPSFTIAGAAFTSADTLLVTTATNDFFLLNANNGGLSGLQEFNYGTVLKGFTAMLNVASSVEEEGSLAPNPAMKVFPNPAGNQLQVEFTQPVSGQFVLLNLQGQRVRQQTTENTRHIVLNLEDLAPGVYLLNAQLEGGALQRRIVVR